MKLTARSSSPQRGFALPTVLLISVILTIILVTSISAVSASRVALDSQYYNELAKHAAESGVARANDCLKDSGLLPQWSTGATALTPATACTGTGTGFSAYTVSLPSVRTSFNIEAPASSGIGSNLKVTGTAELLRTSTNSTGGNNVWRKYTYTTYMRIEPPETVSCPQGFIPVPGNSLFGTSEFCVAKYETKNVNGRATSQPGGASFTNINQLEAINASAGACDGCHLITEAEWLTVAHNVLNVAVNWTGGAVGSGVMYRGHSDSTYSCDICAASADDNDGYINTGNSASSGADQRRTLRLSNGQTIWDLSGNNLEWTSGQLSGGNHPYRNPDVFGSWDEYQDVNVKGYALSPASPLYSPFPSYGTPAAASWGHSQYIGRIATDNFPVGTTKGFVRGGGRDGTQDGYGVFSLILSRNANGGFDHNFRMAK